MVFNQNYPRDPFLKYFATRVSPSTQRCSLMLCRNATAGLPCSGGQNPHYSVAGCLALQTIMFNAGIESWIIQSHPDLERFSSGKNA